MKRILLTAVLFSFTLTLFACNKQMEKPQDDSRFPTASFSETIDHTKNDSGNRIYLFEESPENLISVQIPTFSNANAMAVNACVKEQVYRELERWIPVEKFCLKESNASIEDIGEKIDSDEYARYSLHISSSVSFEDDNIISIIFKGNHYEKTAAHPNDVFFSINVDVEKAERIGIIDVYSIDDSVYNAFLEHVQSDRISHEELLSLNIFEKEALLKGLALEPEKEFYSYFTPTSVGISYPVPYALGGHVEAEIAKAEFSLGQGDGSPVPKGKTE